MPHIEQHYIVPFPLSAVNNFGNNDLGVFSMWEHFLDFLKCDPLSIITIPRQVPLCNPFTLTNPYTNKKRLPVLVKLSQQKSIE